MDSDKLHQLKGVWFNTVHCPCSIRNSFLNSIQWHSLSDFLCYKIKSLRYITGSSHILINQDNKSKVFLCYYTFPLLYTIPIISCMTSAFFLHFCYKLWHKTVHVLMATGEMTRTLAVPSGSHRTFWDWIYQVCQNCALLLVFCLQAIFIAEYIK